MMVGKGMGHLEGGKYRTKDIIKLKNVFAHELALIQQALGKWKEVLLNSNVKILGWKINQ